MKKITLLVVCTIFANVVFGQFWMEAGLKGAVGATFLNNSNILNDGNAGYKIKNNFATGARLAFNFGDSHGVNVEGLYAKSKAYYSGQVGTQPKALNYTWSNVETYVLYRYYYERSFIELGPKISTLSKMDLNGASVKTNFSGQNYAAALGFGGFLAGSENISLSLNFRVDYQFTDFVSETGKAANYPFTLGKYDKYVATSPLTGRIGLDLTFALGGVAKAKCGERVFFFGGGR